MMGTITAWGAEGNGLRLGRAYRPSVVVVVTAKKTTSSMPDYSDPFRKYEGDPSTTPMPRFLKSFRVKIKLRGVCQQLQSPGRAVHETNQVMRILTVLTNTAEGYAFAKTHSIKLYCAPPPSYILIAPEQYHANPHGGDEGRVVQLSSQTTMMVVRDQPKAPVQHLHTPMQEQRRGRGPYMYEVSSASQAIQLVQVQMNDKAGLYRLGGISGGMPQLRAPLVIKLENKTQLIDWPGPT
ncbi:hypothetical protein BJ165DRAFT_1409833 [Panaeolus papilionaceus]|nr:hypothetical protein BJ165DRAFT_1409833 [Panaeolus papilionaceus]